MPNVQLRPRRPLRPAGIGQKNNDQIRIRNRRYKIKRLIAQPKNVKRNGVVVSQKKGNLSQCKTKTRVLNFCIGHP